LSSKALTSLSILSCSLLANSTLVQILLDSSGQKRYSRIARSLRESSSGLIPDQSIWLDVTFFREGKRFIYVLREIRTLQSTATSMGNNSNLNIIKALERPTQIRICVKQSWTILSDINWWRQISISPGQNMVGVPSRRNPAVGRLGQWVEERLYVMLEDINNNMGFQIAEEQKTNEQSFSVILFVLWRFVGCASQVGRWLFSKQIPGTEKAN
jgi:hypothetical protein